jgi:hypothetical protein
MMTLGIAVLFPLKLVKIQTTDKFLLVCEDEVQDIIGNHRSFSIWGMLGG